LGKSDVEGDYYHNWGIQLNWCYRVRGESDAFAFVLVMYVILGASFYTFFKKWLSMSQWNERGIVAKMGFIRYS
jgi:undecaprenyl pyrophosphate phosphatase UppP